MLNVRSLQRRSTRILILLFATALGFPISAVALGNVTLAWQPSPDPTVVGYNVYWELANGAYPQKVSVSSQTATVSNLVEAMTYSFFVTAYTSSGMESAPTAPIVYTVPGSFLQLGRSAQNNLVLSSSGAAAFPWALQESSDLKVWRTISQGTNSAVNLTMSTSGSPMEFFRFRSQ